MENDPYQHTNWNAGCVRPSLIEDTARGAACFWGLERFTACLANDSLWSRSWGASLAAVLAEESDGIEHW